MGPLNSYAANRHSQNGEDGIIAELLRRLDHSGEKTERWCVEFGAWDGRLNSNTFALVENGWNAVYIEADGTRFRELRQTAVQFPSITPIHARVSHTPADPNSLDALLSTTKIPIDFDVLSIDIGSFDADVWEATEKYRPAIVIIEINSSIEPGIIQRHGTSGAGNSFSATLEVGCTKGYFLVCHTGNMIFVREDLVSRLSLPEGAMGDPTNLFLRDWIGRTTPPPSPRASTAQRLIRKLTRR